MYRTSRKKWLSDKFFLQIIRSTRHDVPIEVERRLARHLQEAMQCSVQPPCWRCRPAAQSCMLHCMARGVRIAKTSFCHHAAIPAIEPRWSLEHDIRKAVMATRCQNQGQPYPIGGPVPTIIQKNVWSKTKKRKKSRFWIFKKNVKT